MLRRSRGLSSGVGAAVNMDPIEGLRQTGSQFMQLARVIAGQRAQQPCASGRKPQQHAAAVFWVLRAQQQSLALRPVDQFDHAVVALAKAAGCVGDCRRRPCGRTRYLQQKLMLLRLQADCLCRILAELQEAPQLEAEIGEGGEQGIWNGEAGSGIHSYIVLRCI